MATATAAAQPDQTLFRLAGPHNEPAIDDDLDEDYFDDEFDDFDDEDDDEDFEDEGAG